MASKASATAIIRAARGICSPPIGVPAPGRACEQGAAAAVVPGGHAGHDLQDFFRGATAAEDFQAHRAGPRHDGHFLAVQPGRLQEHVIRRADDAHVVQQRGDFQLLALRLVEVQPRRPGRAGQSHAHRVRGGSGVLALQGGEETAGDAQPPLCQPVVGAFFGRGGERWRRRTGRFPTPSAACPIGTSNDRARRPRVRPPRSGSSARNWEGLSWMFFLRTPRGADKVCGAVRLLKQ